MFKGNSLKLRNSCLSNSQGSLNVSSASNNVVTCGSATSPRLLRGIPSSPSGNLSQISSPTTVHNAPSLSTHPLHYTVTTVDSSPNSPRSRPGSPSIEQRSASLRNRLKTYNLHSRESSEALDPQSALDSPSVSVTASNAIHDQLPSMPVSGMHWSRVTVQGKHRFNRLRAHAACPIGSRLYVFGGSDGSTCQNDLYIFDTGECKMI
jgi:hypothetical protein